jgi:hypothetical protein
MSTEPNFQRRGGRVRGAEGYHRGDVEALLRCVRQVLPTCTEEWDEVLNAYRQTHAVPKLRAQRDANSLKVKFKQLVRAFKPSRNSDNVAPELQEAGAIIDLIEAKTAGGNCLQRRGGRTRGAEGFSAADARAILDTVRRLLPVNRTEWEGVAEEYCRSYAAPNGRVMRDGVSLKSRFRNWAKDNVMPQRAEVEEAREIQAEVDAKLELMGKGIAEMEELGSAGAVNTAAQPVGVGSIRKTSTGASPAATALELSSTSSESAEKPPVFEPRRGGRSLGSEGYTQSDTRALLACIKEVLPSGPSSWEHVLHLYRMRHATPHNRAPRNLTGIKSKFRQLVNWRQDQGKEAPQEILDARAIQSEIDQGARIGKHPRSESGSNASFSYSPEEGSPEVGEERHLGQPHAEPRNNENLERQNVVGWSVNSRVHVPDAAAVEKRQKQDAGGASVPTDPEGTALRSEIASRELELLRQREQREAEQAAWEKERALSEKQQADMKAWTFVCDRLRQLYRERAAESNLEILGEIEEEVAVLKRKKQRLAGSMM